MSPILKAHLAARPAHEDAWRREQAELSEGLRRPEVRERWIALNDRCDLGRPRPGNLVVVCDTARNLKWWAKYEQRVHDGECLARVGAVGVLVYRHLGGLLAHHSVLLPNGDLIETQCKRHRLAICERLIDGLIAGEDARDLRVLYENWCDRQREHERRGRAVLAAIAAGKARRGR